MFGLKFIKSIAQFEIFSAFYSFFLLKFKIVSQTFDISFVRTNKCIAIVQMI